MQNRTYPLMHQDLLEIKENILATLAYFDMFSYPLTGAEIYSFLKKSPDYDLFDDALTCLLNNGAVYCFDKFYTLKNDRYLIIRRIEGNKKAEKLMKIAWKVGDLLIRFPFVRGIAISGSLSKNYADDYSDVDLFIVTEKNRLWIARTLMHCFKKLTFLFSKEHFFCMNYYIDEEQLEISEKNIYTAIEICTLIPLQGDVVFENFFAANMWTRQFLPNKNMRISSAKPGKASVFKQIFERMINIIAGNAIDDLLMKITTKRWAKKTILKKLNNHGTILGLLTDKHYAKPDPKNFQGSLLKKYGYKVSRLLREYSNERIS